MKPATQPADSTGLSDLFQYPARLNTSSPVLGSTIDLRTNPLIAYSVYAATHAASPNEQLSAVEAARRCLVLEYASQPLADSLLPSVYVVRDRISLYVFAMGSTSEASPSHTALASLQLENLERYETYTFTPDSIYPCSLACAAQIDPCPTCLPNADTVITSPAASSSQSTPACILPRRHLRLPFAQFLQATRDRVVDDMVLSPLSHRHVTARHVFRLQGGIMLSPASLAEPSEWSTGWDHNSRQLTHCQIHAHLSRTRILVQPVLRSTRYFPLSAILPLPMGTSIVLAPHGVPAYFLSVYSGPVGGITRQFEDALVGLGCGDWKGAARPQSQNTTPDTSYTYIIAWLSVQNKQGEEKGLPVIWPISLAILQDSTLQVRQRLAHIPNLPPQLLASPPAVPAQAPPIRFPLSSLNPPHRSQAASVALEQHLHAISPTTSQSEHSIHFDVKHPGASLSSSPLTDSMKAFRSLTIRHKNLPNLAHDVSTFVSSVAQDREKERERLKRGRDGSSSKISSSPAKQESELTRTPQTPVKRDDIQPIFLAPALTLFLPADPTNLKSADPTALLPAWSPAPNPNSIDQPMLVDDPSPGETIKTESEAHDTLSEIGGPGSNDANVVAGTSTTSFDPYGSFTNAWNQPEKDFMDINAGLDSYSFDMDMAGFTDDDFSFFDAPQSTVRTSAPGLPLPPTTVPGSHNNFQMSGPGPPSHSAHAVPVVSSVTQLAGMTPRSMPASTPGVVPPELMPSTPAQTPPSQSGPATPAAVVLDHTIHLRRSSASSQGSQFDPVPFGSSHKVMDGKYTSGKFALPTPPPDEIEELWPAARGTASSSGWKFAYSAKTDPRIGIVRRLVGMKRKRLGEKQRGSYDRLSPAWMREHEEWTSQPVQGSEDPDTDSSDSDDDLNNECPEAEAQSAVCPSRPYTPPVPYLPLGPTLVQTGFHHSFLLPLSSALRPPGTVLDVNMGPLSVPTPVSPAAALGAASERTKALEAVVQLLFKEIVENPFWAEAWQAGLAATRASSSVAPNVWPADVRYTSWMLGCVDGLRNALDLKEAYQADASDGSPSLKELDDPTLSIGKSDALVQVLPSALRFWEKLGLKPRGGSKDVTAFLFFEKTDDAREEKMASWLQSLSQTYGAKNLGQHALGHAVGCTKDGLIPVQYDAIKKTLTSFVIGLHESTSPTVFYVVVPVHAINLASPLLRQILSAARKVKKARPDAPLLIHLIPEPFITGHLDSPFMRHQGLEILADSVYDRMPLVAKRMSARSLTPDVPRMQALFQEPAFTLARPLARRATFRLEAHPTSLDVVDRLSILHIGYSISPCGKWLLAACIDQRGEAHELRAWLVPSDGAEIFVVNSVWAFAFHVAAKASVEWRIVIAKLGSMEEAEVDTWDSQFHSASREILPSQVFLLCVDPDRPWNFIPSESMEVHKTPRSPQRANKHSAGTVFHDASSSTYLVHNNPTAPLSLDRPIPIVPAQPHIPDVEEDASHPPCIIRPLSSLSLVNVPAGTDFTAISMIHLHLLHSIHLSSLTVVPLDRTFLDDIAQNFHDLALLTKYRWKLKTSPLLPFHLAALEVMSMALVSTNNESFTD